MGTLNEFALSLHKDRDRLREVNKELLAACRFALEHVFDPPKGWYPADVFPDKDGTVEQQIERGRDAGPAYVSRAREMLRAAIAKATGEQ